MTSTLTPASTVASTSSSGLVPGFRFSVSRTSANCNLQSD